MLPSPEGSGAENRWMAGLVLKWLPFYRQLADQGMSNAEILTATIIVWYSYVLRCLKVAKRRCAAAAAAVAWRQVAQFGFICATISASLPPPLTIGLLIRLCEFCNGCLAGVSPGGTRVVNHFSQNISEFAGNSSSILMALSWTLRKHCCYRVTFRVTRQKPTKPRK